MSSVATRVETTENLGLISSHRRLCINARIFALDDWFHQDGHLKPTLWMDLLALGQLRQGGHKKNWYLPLNVPLKGAVILITNEKIVLKVPEFWEVECSSEGLQDAKKSLLSNAPEPLRGRGIARTKEDADWLLKERDTLSALVPKKTVALKVYAAEEIWNDNGPLPKEKRISECEMKGDDEYKVRLRLTSTFEFNMKDVLKRAEELDAEFSKPLPHPL